MGTIDRIKRIRREWDETLDLPEDDVEFLIRLVERIYANERSY